jgi:transposase InsO family protein
MKLRSETIDKMIEYYNHINIQSGHQIQRIRADNAGEYRNQKWLDFAQEKGIKMEYTAPYTPAQNGISERFNRTIVERTIAVMKNRNIPIFLWPEIMKSIVKEMVT